MSGDPHVLLAPELAPITFAAGFLERPLAEVEQALRGWYAEAGLARTLTPVRAPFANALRELEPLAAPEFRRLWIATTSPRWPTAYFDGFVNGTDAAPPIGYLAERLGCRGLVTGAQPDTASCYGATHVALYGPSPTEWLNLEWQVAVMNDGGRWTFRRSGAVQPFEEPAAYANRRVRDRLPLDLLRRYCRTLDVPLDPTAFGPACLLDAPAKRALGPRRESLAQARARFGLAAGAT